MAATRQRITEAAVELHGTVGPARTTITAVAERAGVQRHTVYRHFPDRGGLFEACSGHFRRATPGRTRAPGRRSTIPTSGSRVALDELYAYYERTEAMLTNILRDTALVGAVEPALTPFRAFVEEAAGALAVGWGSRGGRRKVVAAAARHAVDFATWRSLARDGGVRRAHAVELARSSCGPPGARPAPGQAAAARRGRGRRRRRRAQLGAARRARQVTGELAAAVAVVDDDRGPVLRGVMAIAPLHQGHHHRPQVDALLGEPVLEARRALLVGRRSRMPSSTSGRGGGSARCARCRGCAGSPRSGGTRRNASRRISSVQRSPTSSSVRAIEQFWSS